MAHMHHLHSHHRFHHNHKRWEDFSENPTFRSFPLAVEQSDVLIPRSPQTGSSDNYGAAPGETADSNGGGGGGGSGGNSNGGSSPSTENPSTPSSPPSGIASGAGGEHVAIALAVILPISFVAITLLVIWRIVKKRQRMEDLNDKHASLDFGLGEVSRAAGSKKGGARKGAPEMMDLNAEKEFRKARGMSMDMGSPYVAAADTMDSRPSFTASLHDGEDPYRPSTLARSDSPSRSPSRFSSRPASRKDTASVWTQSSEASHGMRSDLIKNAQMPSRTTPPSSGETPLLSQHQPSLSPIPSVPGGETPSATPNFNFARKPVGTTTATPIAAEEAGAHEMKTPQVEIAELPATGLGLHTDKQAKAEVQDKGFDFQLPTINPLPEISENGLPSFSVTEAAADDTPPPPPRRSSARPAFKATTQHESIVYDEYATYADVLGIVQKESDAPIMPEQGLGVSGIEVNERRVSVNFRPLPPEDPADNPEMRANRIRSFYKEYFDDSKRDTHMMGGARASTAGYGGYDYYEDYGQEYLNDATFVDPSTGQFIVASAPYSQHVTRRAMTPPPRAPPRYGRGSNGSNRMHGPGPQGPGRQRGFSTASGQGFRGRMPKRNLPPPSPLANLPTPHLLREDSAVFNATDFAPPKTYRDRAAGRPDSPLAGQKPYSPSVRSFTPLQSSFDELRAMPSPYALRKSGTFTGLDFAPPPRLNSDAGSDAGSIRSGRSQMSTSQLASIRAGAYRVSRIPKDAVGTKDDLAAALRPTWQQRA